MFLVDSLPPRLDRLGPIVPCQMGRERFSYRVSHRPDSIKAHGTDADN